MLSRSRLYLAPGTVNDYRSSSKIADEFQHVLLRNRWAFDHVAIDVGYLCAVAGRFTRDLIGHDRDVEAVKIVQKQIQHQILRRLGGNKSLALLLDGSEPLWKVQHMRLHPGRKFPEKFYRSAASPMVYLLEDRLRTLGPEIRPAPVEFLVSGPGVPGPAEGKATAWALDLATRIVRPATNPPEAAAVSPNDSVCFVGNTDLFLNVLAATPFHNVTAVTFNSGEIKSLSLKNCLEWLGLNDLLEPAAPTPGVGAQQQEQEQQQQQQKLAAVRTDVVLLYLMANGTSSTNLAPFGIGFADLMDGYRAELKAFKASTPTVASKDGAPTSQKYFSGLLFDEHPLAATAASAASASSFSSSTEAAPLSLPSLRLKPAALARVLAQAAKRPITFPSRPCPNSSNYLEMLLQTHAMLTSGSVQSYGWVPAGYGDDVPDKPPKIALDQLVGHLRAVGEAGELGSGAPSRPAYVCPTRNRSFALTGLESLLLTSPEASIIDQVVPMYARGHTMPAGVAQDIVSTRNVFTALEKTRAVLSGLVALATDSSSSSSSSLTHPAITHYPSHYLVKSAGARGPPPGWRYHSVNLGLKAEAMNIRYSLNASDTAHLQRDLSVTSESGLSKRNHMYVYDPAGDAWREVPCEAIGAADASSTTVAAAPVSTLRVLTWNTQFSRHSGERTPLGRDGIDWCSPTRYLALSAVLAAADADVIAMQEVEPAWCAYLSAQSWVRDGYAMSCHEGSHAIAPWGVLLLVRRTLSVAAFTHANVAAFSGHTSAMPEVTISLGSQTAPVTIGSMHLLAPYSQNNVSNRETQLDNLIKHLEGTTGASTSTSTPGGGRARIVMGDFNDYPGKFFHFPAALGFKDAWQALHPRCDEITLPPTQHGASDEENEAARAAVQERGYTIDGHMNPYAARIIEAEFFGRADRIMYAAAHLQPVHAELVGTAPVLDVLRDSGVTHLVERPAEKIPEYLFPSDHFGVLVEFQVT